MNILFLISDSYRLLLIFFSLKNKRKVSKSNTDFKEEEKEMPPMLFSK